MQAVKDINSINKEDLLGYMMFYHVPDIKISHDELRNVFKNNSIDEASLPPKIYEHDAFRRATGRVKGTINVTLPSGTNCNAKLNIDEVRNDSDLIVRILGRKVIDEVKEDVDYAPVCKFVFDKNTKSATSSVNFSFADEYDYKQLLQETVDLFNEWTVYHSKDTVRTIINKIVKGTQPVSIIKGAYFIPKSEYDIIKGLQGVIKDLAQFTPNEVPEIEVIPLLDTVEQRVMVEKKVNSELMSEVDTVMNELADMLLEGKEIHTRTIKRITNQFQDLQTKTGTYAKLLDIKMSAVSQQLLSAIDKFAKMKAAATIESEECTEENME